MGPPLAASPPENWMTRQLYGGALTARVPARMLDVSDARPVPDHQEVFADASRDQSLIFEIVEHQGGVPDDRAAAFYFDDQAQQNGAAESVLQEARALPPDAAPGMGGRAAASGLAVGTQVAAKGRQGESARNVVQVALVALRLPGVGSDLLVCINTPTCIAEASAAAEHAGAGERSAGDAPGLLLEVVRSLQVHDWGLFGGGEG